MMRPALALCAALALVFVSCQEPPATEPVARGRQVYRQQGCERCHRIDASGASLGPELTHLATVAASRRPGQSAEDYIKESLDQPGAYIVPGYNDVMPRGLVRGLSAFDAESLVRYLMTLE
jgi:cytochrome c2